jgi:hypothetical protein
MGLALRVEVEVEVEADDGAADVRLVREGTGGEGARAFEFGW